MSKLEYISAGIGVAFFFGDWIDHNDTPIAARFNVGKDRFEYVKTTGQLDIKNLLPVVKRIVLDQGISPAIPAEFIIWVIEPKSCSICLIGFYTAS